MFFTRSTEPDTDTRADAPPWASAHATLEDRAVGLELELIELESRRNGSDDPAALDAQADDVFEELATVAEQLATLRVARVRIHAPVAAAA
ncbi:MAG: hypothetical protein JWM05_3598 [Acidimicrobiales bacterium]|nr:hypothetical protein [Acidimicrobiales bacterium]